MIKGRVHSIETMGLVDGPGIRTVVFMQGCSLKCLYCHNPDTQCMKNNKSKLYTSEEIVKMAKRYEIYYKKSGGGVTFSGGEPLMQSDFLLEVLRELKNQGINTAIDTCGYGNLKNLKEIFEVTDNILLDVKHFDKDMFQIVTGRDMNHYMKFIDHLKDYKGNLWIRHVVVPGFTDTRESMEKLANFILSIPANVAKVEIIPYHKLGIEKYEKLGIEYKLKDIPEMDKNHAKALEKYLISIIDKQKTKKVSLVI